MRPDPKVLRELFDYNLETGWLTWRARAGRDGRIAPGMRAGGERRVSKRRGVSFCGGHFEEATVIWAWMTGKWPTLTIDHKNRDATDNRWSNLREATKEQQSQNRAAHKDNTIGFKCVEYVKRSNRYRWYVMTNGQRKSSGYFKTAKEAFRDYQLNVKQLQGEFAHDGS